MTARPLLELTIADYLLNKHEGFISVRCNLSFDPHLL